MAIKTYGTMAVDWERRIDFDRLRRERLARIKEHAGQVGAGRGALLRHEQRPLHHGHAHRHVGAGQDQPLHAAAAERRADPLGLRLRRAPSPAELRLAGRALARRHPADARRDDARDGPLRGSRAQDQARAREARPAQGAGRRRRRRAAGPVRAAEGRAEHRRRPAADVGRARDQDGGRDLAAHALGGDGGRRLLRALQGDEARHARERCGGAGRARCSTRWARSTSRASTPSRASAAARTRTCSPIA